MTKISLILLILVICSVTITASLLSSSYNTLLRKLDLISHITLLTLPGNVVGNDSFSLIPKASGLTLDGAIGLSSVLSRDIAIATTAPGPTYNPPLKKCETGTAGATVTEGGFDIAKYVVTGKLNKDKIKGDKFSFNIFSDLVKNDGVEIKGQDAPYKANYATKDGDEIADINLDEIATICVDTAKIVNVAEITDIDLEDSALFESLNYK